MLIKSISICHARNIDLRLILISNIFVKIIYSIYYYIRINLIYRSNISDILFRQFDLEYDLFVPLFSHIYLSFFYLFRNTLHWHITEETFIFFISYEVILN